MSNAHSNVQKWYYIVCMLRYMRSACESSLMTASATAAAAMLVVCVRTAREVIRELAEA
jgi:hypothetical protein